MLLPTCGMHCRLLVPSADSKPQRKECRTLSKYWRSFFEKLMPSFTNRWRRLMVSPARAVASNPRAGDR